MKVVGVQFNKCGKIYNFINKDNLELYIDCPVIVESSRGKELGFVVKLDKEIPNKSEAEIENIKSIANDEMLKTYDKNREKAQLEKSNVQQIIKKVGLNIKVNAIEYTIDNSKMIISFASEERVDFRELVRQLVSKYKMKIELKQIGPRDEVKQIGSLGVCGRVCCCKNHLREFEKVGIKMAKNQNLSLNPTKISGVCGKLMCCLAYENDTYTELNKDMPKINSIVTTPKGEAIVVYNDIFKRIVTVKLANANEEFEMLEFPLSELKNVKKD